MTPVRFIGGAEDGQTIDVENLTPKFTGVPRSYPGGHFEVDQYVLCIDQYDRDPFTYTAQYTRTTRCCDLAKPEGEPMTTEQPDTGPVDVDAPTDAELHAQMMKVVHTHRAMELAEAMVNAAREEMKRHVANYELAANEHHDASRALDRLIYLRAMTTPPAPD